VLRRVLLAAATSLAVLTALGSGVAQAAALPPEGVFESCPLDSAMSTCIQRLDAMHQGGLQVVVLNAWAGSPDSLSTYAQAAHDMGMSVMWNLSNPGWWRDPADGTQQASYFRDFASACGCDQNGALLDYIIGYLAALPGTYGYYAADDSMLGAGDGPGVSAYVAQIKQVDPVHTVMIGAFGEGQSRQFENIPDVIGTELYPVTVSSLLPVASNQDMWAAVGQWATDAQNMADAAGKQSAFILQAFTWGDNLSDGQSVGVCSPTDTQASCYRRLVYPPPEAQLELRNEVLLHAHPKLILWYSFQGTYGQAGSDTYSIYPTGSVAAARWNGLAAAIQAPAPQPVTTGGGGSGNGGSGDGGNGGPGGPTGPVGGLPGGPTTGQGGGQSNPRAGTARAHHARRGHHHHRSRGHHGPGRRRRHRGGRGHGKSKFLSELFHSLPAESTQSLSAEIGSLLSIFWTLAY
jgi:hypothetical protein